MEKILRMLILGVEFKEYIVKFYGAHPKIPKVAQTILSIEAGRWHNYRARFFAGRRTQRKKRVHLRDQQQSMFVTSQLLRQSRV